MDFTKEIRGDVVLERVNLIRATLKEAEPFQKKLASDIEAGWRKIIVDLSECEFIDSTFLGALVLSQKKLNAVKGDLKLIISQPTVDSMFELTRMDRVFETFKTYDDAVASFD